MRNNIREVETLPALSLATLKMQYGEPNAIYTPARQSRRLTWHLDGKSVTLIEGERIEIVADDLSAEQEEQ